MAGQPKRRARCLKEAAAQKPPTKVAPDKPTEEPRRGRGRPSLYTDELALKICEHIADGNSLASFCSREDAPGRVTVYRWILEHDDFRDKYVRARQLMADTFVDDSIDIADRSSKEPADVHRDRLRVDTRKWAAAKYNGGKYGDRAEVNVNAHHHHTESVSQTDEWLEKLFGHGTNSQDPKPVSH